MMMTVIALVFHLIVSAQSISLNLSNVSVKTAMETLQKEYGYSFVFASGDVDTQKTISVRVQNVLIDEVVRQILQGQNDLVYEINNKNIIVRKQIQRTVTGTVTDETGEPMPGVNIIIKGTIAGVISDVNGKYTIIAPDKDAVLIFSFVGYAAQEFLVGDQRTINVTLGEETRQIEEVVVVGYGTQKKINLTGAVDQVTSKQFENRPVANITQMLQGAVPNLNISLDDGKPNRSASYNIRGITSIGAGGGALVLIDGVESDPAMLNPNDVESVTVLKDAASSAIYGSRAPYGVVLITTKEPDRVKDKFTVNYTSSVSIEIPTAIPDVVSDGYVYALLFYDSWWNYRFNEPTTINKSQEFSHNWLNTFKERKLAGNTIETTVTPDGKYVYYGNTDYYDVIYKDHTIAQNHNISVSGSNGMISSYISARLYNYDGLFNFKPDTYRTLNLRSKNSAQMLPWIKVSNNFDYTWDRYIQPQGYFGEGSGVLWRSINDEGHPSAPVFNPDGTLTKAAAYGIGGLVTGNSWRDRITQTLKNTSTINITTLQNRLRLTGDFSFRTRNYTETRKQTAIPYSERLDEIAYLGTPETQDVMVERLQLTTYIATNAYTEFEDMWRSKHYFKALLGYNYEQQDYKTTRSERNGLLMPNLESINFAMGDEMSVTSDGERWRYVGTFFRLNYAYDERYLIEVNGRYDGSSKFPNNSQWGFFPSISAAWRISQEDFWQVNSQAVSNLKLRGSYGSLGNSNVAPYTYMERFQLNTFGTGSGADARFLYDKARLRYTNNPSQVPDNIGWEISRTFNVGADVGFLKNRINLTADYYVRKTIDMYTVGPTLPDTYGTSAPRGNYAEMTTRGYEISLSYSDRFNLGNKPFNFGVKTTLADYYSVIDKYNNESRRLSDYYAGQHLGEIWGFVCNGLFQYQDEIDSHWNGKGYSNPIMQTSENYVSYPGDMRIEDLNNNQEIDRGSETVDDPGDRRIIGNSEPRWIFSLSLSADWNNFFFSAFFDGVGRQHWFPSAECFFWGQYNRPYNQIPKWHLGNYWTEDNRDAYLPRYAGYYGPFKANTTNISDRYTQNVAYMRLKNIQFGYNLPLSWISAIGLTKASVYFSGENLWNWSPLYRWTRDFDVVNATRTSDIDVNDSRGDGYNYPTMRSFSLGLSITF